MSINPFDDEQVEFVPFMETEVTPLSLFRVAVISNVHNPASITVIS
jgi:hypothetical protein